MTETYGSESFVTDNFRRYYASHAQTVAPPREVAMREFGFLSFGGRSMYRHVGFRDIQELRRYLIDYAPAHSYHSAAYYEHPQATMDKKNWLGADLVFDIDVDHFDLPCQNNHDRWVCRQCGKEGVGHPPESCPTCGKASYEEENWLCSECLEVAKYEIQKLIDILVQDLGFSATEELDINFSGNRGYHVHVHSPKVRMLNQIARRELVDYIMGTGIEAEYQGFTSRPVGGGSSIHVGGWRTRTIQALYDYIQDMTENDAKRLKFRKPTMEKIFENREYITRALMEKHPSVVSRYIDPKHLARILDEAITELGSHIDTVVTTDLRRLIRLPNTLHGKTGWLVHPLTVDTLSDYDPLMDAIAFREGSAKIYVRHTPVLEVMGERYGPYEDEVQELPLAVALFILCRKAGRVA
jgi:DNA primase small subunit